MSPQTQALVSIIVASLGVMSALGVAFLSRAQARESRQIADLRADVAVLKTERDEAEDKERLMADYALLLRKEIVTTYEGTPPPWPDGLRP